MTNYEKYRGKCREMSEALAKERPELQLVRGWYYDPLWGKQGHWWCKTPEGEIVDPTKLQFPSAGRGVYEEFDGFFECDNCGKRTAEADIVRGGTHPFCSDDCYRIFVLGY